MDWLKWIIPVLLLPISAIYSIPQDRFVPSIEILHIENLGSEGDEFWARAVKEDMIIDVAAMVE